MHLHLAGGGSTIEGGGGYKCDGMRNVHPGNVLISGEGGPSVSLTVISTLGNMHKAAGYSFPFLPSALRGGLQCGWGGGSDNSQHVYTGPKK